MDKKIKTEGKTQDDLDVFMRGHKVGYREGAKDCALSMLCGLVIGAIIAFIIFI